MKILVVGCGSIGAKHIGNLRELGVTEILAVDENVGMLEEVGAKYGVQGHSSLVKALVEKPQLVLICTPPNLHVSQAFAALRCGCHCFIEKPISDREEDLSKLVAEAEYRQLKLLVGYNLRFETGATKLRELTRKEHIGRVLYVRAEVGSYLPDWRPWQDYRTSYTARREMGGGAILDMSHELDLVRWLVGDVTKVFCAANQFGDLEIDVEDTAEVILWFRNEVLGSVHMDIVQRARSRYCKIVGTEGSVILDFVESQVRWYSAGSQKWEIFQQETDRNDSYVREMKNVLNCVAGLEPPLVTGHDGWMALRIALAAKRSADTGRIVNLSN